MEYIDEGPNKNACTMYDIPAWNDESDPEPTLLERIRDVFPKGSVDVSKLGTSAFEVEFDRDVDITFDMLQQISEIVGHKGINFEFYKERRGYSEYTPGDPAHVSLVIDPRLVYE